MSFVYLKNMLPSIKKVVNLDFRFHKFPAIVSDKLIVFGPQEVASLEFINRVLYKYSQYRLKRRNRRPFLKIANYDFKNSILGLKLEFSGRFSRAQRKYFSSHQKGRVPFNSFVIPIRTFCLPVTLKYGVSTVKVWIAYTPSLKLINYAFIRFKFNYICYSCCISYFVKQTWFSKVSLARYLKNKKFKPSLRLFYLLV